MTGAKSRLFGLALVIGLVAAGVIYFFDIPDIPYITIIFEQIHNMAGSGSLWIVSYVVIMDFLMFFVIAMIVLSICYSVKKKQMDNYQNTRGRRFSQDRTWNWISNPKANPYASKKYYRRRIREK